MIQTVEAVIDEQCTVRLLQPAHVPAARRALVTILDEKPTLNATETAPVEEWNGSRADMGLLRPETAAWDAASDEDALTIEKLLAEMH